MAFMKPDVQYGSFYDVETTFGREIVPVEVCPGAETVGDLGDYLEGRPYGVLCEAPIVSEGWLGRLSAPGYMDCTPWSVYASEEEALEDLLDEEEEETEGEMLVEASPIDRLKDAARRLVTHEHTRYLEELLHEEESEADEQWNEALRDIKDALRELDSHG